MSLYHRRVTVLETIQRGTDFLAKKGVDSPRLQVELLLAHLLKMQRMRLYLDFERQVTEAEVTALRELLRRRGQREPLQHILGTACFCGLEIAVDSCVLIPRPETEMLAEMGWKFLQKTADAASRVLDFGTGSGCIAIALARNCPAAAVTAVDISQEALAAARENAERNNVASQIQFAPGDGFAALPAGSRFHLIVSNPPYIPSADIAGLEPEVRDHDPRAALDGGADGLDFYRRLARDAVPFLEPGGRMMLEFGDGQAEAIQKIFEAQNWIVEAIESDYNRRLRFLTAGRMG